MVTVASDGNGKRSHINWNCSARAGSSDRCRLTHSSTYVSDAQSWWSHRCILPSRTGRGAPRLRRGAPNVWGFGGHLGAPMSISPDPAALGDVEFLVVGSPVFGLVVRARARASSVVDVRPVC